MFNDCRITILLSYCTFCSHLFKTFLHFETFKVFQWGIVSKVYQSVSLWDGFDCQEYVGRRVSSCSERSRDWSCHSRVISCLATGNFWSENGDSSLCFLLSTQRSKVNYFFIIWVCFRGHFGPYVILTFENLVNNISIYRYMIS